MLTLSEIINVTFRRAGFSGYRTEDVDAFVDAVKETVEALLHTQSQKQEEMDALRQENRQLEKKLEILAGKVEEYRSEEDGIKTALMSAQKLGDASVREARHKAEIILRDAELKAEKIVGAADAQAKSRVKELENLKQQVSDFRSRILAMYKEHLTLLTAIPAENAVSPVKEEADSVSEEEIEAPIQGNTEPVPFEEREDFAPQQQEEDPQPEQFQFSPANPFEE